MEQLFFRLSKPFERYFLSVEPPFTFCHNFWRKQEKRVKGVQQQKSGVS